MVTLRDVALAAGCSTATASRALNDDPRISDSRKAVVRKEAERLGYQASQIARSLRRRATGYVGVVVPTVMTNYWAYCVSYLTDQLAARGLHVVLGCHSFNASTDASLVRSLLERRVEGLLHVPCTTDGIEGMLDSPAVPIVEVGQRSNSTRVDAVYLDDASGIERIVRYLYGLGHRRIAMLAGRTGLIGVDAQVRGFHRAAAELGLGPEQTRIVHSPVNYHDFQERVGELLEPPAERRPTAIIGVHSFAVAACLSVLNQRGISVPREISLIGFSNDDWFEVSNPPLTTYEHPYRAMTIVATQMLLARVQPHPDQPSRPDSVKFEGGILERASTAPPPERA